ncbi:hypothetical protein [Halotia branconii]|uniref:Uncharacterized protein n=1 Tax=Halotia branconii CENA392 TaxID=1539056 RepID=A0AAJ6NSW5_9CYAN|nr:hypothetical protein [Halotia branconii]WGV25985.1 hypothetical protein QI031_00215 [Halotia branconii CENA392]
MFSFILEFQYLVIATRRRYDLWVIGDRLEEHTHHGQVFLYCTTGGRLPSLLGLG